MTWQPGGESRAGLRSRTTLAMILLSGHASPIHALAFSPDGHRLLSGTRDGTIELWEGTARVREFRASQPDGGPVNSVEFLPDGNGFVAGTGTGLICRRGQSADYEPFGPANGGSVTAAHLLSSNLLAVGRGHRAKQVPGTFELWDLAASVRRKPSFPASLGVRAVAVVPARKRVAWSEWGRRLAIWDISRPDHTTIGLPKESVALAFHPDGIHLAVAMEWEVHIFDTDKRYWRAVLKGHKGIVQCVAFSPDGRHLATGSWDGTIRFWDPHSGTEQTALQWPLGRVQAVAFSPDGLRVAAAGDNAQIMLWDID